MAGLARGPTHPTQISRLEMAHLAPAQKSEPNDRPTQKFRPNRAPPHPDPVGISHPKPIPTGKADPIRTQPVTIVRQNPNPMTGGGSTAHRQHKANQGTVVHRHLNLGPSSGRPEREARHG